MKFPVLTMAALLGRTREPARHGSTYWGADTIGWCGMTETLTHGIVTDVDHPGPHGTLGRVAPEYDIQIRREDGSPSACERGVLFICGVRGVSLFKAYYWNDEARERRAFDADGWFDTGDIVRRDEEGWLYFSDRDKTCQRSAGERCRPGSKQDGKRKGAEECAVVGQKHAMLDEVPAVFVIPSEVGKVAERGSRRR